MFEALPELTKPGLFITATDTGVGKTVVSCAIAHALSKRGHRVGVSKPFATGCRKDREGLVNEDAEALAHFANASQSLEVINPIRYLPPLAPAVAAEQENRPPDLAALGRSLKMLDKKSDVLVIEGVGGAFVPLVEDATVIDLMRHLQLPAVIVTRAVLGTLNHTMLTVHALRTARIPIAGVVINGYDADVADQQDASVATNRQWIERMTRLPTLAVLPRCQERDVRPDRGILSEDILEPISRVDWMEFAR